MFSSCKGAVRSLAVIAVALGAVASAPAQNIKAAVSGVVVDSSGASVGGARVTVRNQDSLAEQTTVTSDAGRFHQPALEPGLYIVEAASEGFKTTRTEPISLRVGENPELRLALEIGEVVQTVEVASAAIALGEGDNERSRSFDQAEMNDLPVAGNGFAGRNFYAQALTTPGVTFSELAHRPFAVNGQRPRNNNYMIDSIQVNDPNSGFIAGRGRTEQVVSQEAIAGMEVITHNFKAEYGRNSGSVVSLVSRGGGNDFHGSAYWYHINRALGAREFFEADKAKNRNNLAGFTLGGPIQKNRTFFFGNFETNKERGDDVSTFRTLTAEERARANPIVQPLVDLYPVSPTGSRIFAKGVPAPSDQYTYMFRLDTALTDKQTLMVRNNFTDNASSIQNLAGFVGHHVETNRRTQSITAHHTYTPSPFVVNELRAGYMRFGQFDDFIEPLAIGDPNVHGEIGFMIVPGLSPGGTISFMGAQVAVNLYSLSNDLSLTRGRHTFKFGSSLRQPRSDGGRVNNAFAGTIFFPSIGSFLAAQPLSYTKLEGNPLIGLRRWEWDAYAQDDWRLRRNLTLSLGLRYELYTSPSEMYDRIPESVRFPTDKNNFAPRIGLAWNPLDKTVVRAGYGLFYNAPELDFVGLTRFNPPNLRTLSAFRPQMPNLLGRASEAIPSGLVVPEPNARTSYAQHFNFTVEQQLGGPGSSISAGYVGTVGSKLSRGRLPNGGEDLAQDLRPDPTVGLVTRLETSGVSNYHAFQLGFTQRLRDLTFRTAYTFSKFMDDVSELPTGNTQPERTIIPLSESNLELDQALSDFDVPHMFTFSTLWRIPWMRENRFLGGWTLSGITTMQSGNPYTLFSGTDNGFGSDNNRIHSIAGALAKNPSSAEAVSIVGGLPAAASLEALPGQLGTLGRNTERGDRLFNFNTAVHKGFGVTERVKAQIRVEAFNVFNTTNFNAAAIGNVLSLERDANGLPTGYNPNFGRQGEVFSPRSIQLALRFVF